jgi:hypothetical protein
MNCKHIQLIFDGIAILTIGLSILLIMRVL